MVADQALLLLLSHRLAAPFFIGCAALQDKISELQQVVGDGDDGDGAAPFGRAFSGNAPKLVAQMARLHHRNLGKGRTEPTVTFIGVAALVTARAAVVARAQAAP